jgi:hypothetical protein
MDFVGRFTAGFNVCGSIRFGRLMILVVNRHRMLIPHLLDLPVQCTTSATRSSRATSRT